MRLITLFIGCFLPFLTITAQQPRTDLELKRKQLNEQIAKTNSEIAKVKKSKNNTASQAQQLQKKLKEQEAAIAKINQELAGMDDVIARKEAVISSMEADISQIQSDVRSILRLLYRYELSQGAVLSQIGEAQFAKNQQNRFYGYKLFSLLVEKWRLMGSLQADLQSRKAELEQSKQQKSKALASEISEKAQIAKTAQAKTAQLKTLNQKQKTLENQLAQKQQAKNQLNNKIESIIRNELAAAKTNAKVKTNPLPNSPNPLPAQPTIEANPQLNGQFAANKGKFSYPARGTVVAQFGKIIHSQVPLVVTQNNGIDIKTGANAGVQCIFNGQVVSVFAIPSMGNAVMVKHGEFYTTYSNLSTVTVKRGEMVKTGQSLGLVGKDSQSGNYILHFELWRGKNKENPALWLR